MRDRVHGKIHTLHRTRIPILIRFIEPGYKPPIPRKTIIHFIIRMPDHRHRCIADIAILQGQHLGDLLLRRPRPGRVRYILIMPFLPRKP